MALGFYLNVLVAVLLIATLVFCWILNQKLAIIRNHRAELEALIAAFNDSCLRAESGAKALRSATDEATRLQQYLERSQNLRDDLSYLVDRGGSLADRLEGGVRTARHEVAHPGTKPQPRGNISPLPVRADKLADSMETPSPKANEAAQDQAVPRIRPTRDRASLRQALAGSERLNDGPGEETAPRSRAERELLQALRARR